MSTEIGGTEQGASAAPGVCNDLLWREGLELTLSREEWFHSSQAAFTQRSKRPSQRVLLEYVLRADLLFPEGQTLPILLCPGGSVSTVCSEALRSH